MLADIFASAPARTNDARHAGTACNRVQRRARMAHFREEQGASTERGKECEELRGRIHDSECVLFRREVVVHVRSTMYWGDSMHYEWYAMFLRGLFSGTRSSVSSQQGHADAMLSYSPAVCTVDGTTVSGGV